MVHGLFDLLGENMDCTGNTILITGGGTGIGKALAKRFSAMGNEVIISGRRENRLREVRDEIPGIHIKRCDISDEGDRRELFAFVREKHPSMNVLVNNGAIQTDYDLKAGVAGLDNLESEIAICFTAPIRLNGYFIPFLMNQDNPAIVNVTSVLGFTPIKRIPIYCAAKAGYHVYSLELRKHLEDTRVKVFEVPPPLVETELNPEGRALARARGSEAPKGLLPDDYAAFVIGEMEKDNLDIFYPPMGDLIRSTPRLELELSRLK